MLQTLISIIHIVVALFMILVVLVQGGNAGGVGAALGSGNSSGVFGATGATSLLGKLTYIAAGIFVMTSLSLTKLQGNSGDIGLKEQLEKRNSAVPADTAAPATENKAPEPAPPPAPAQ